MKKVKRLRLNPLWYYLKKNDYRANKVLYLSDILVDL